MLNDFSPFIQIKYRLDYIEWNADSLVVKSQKCTILLGLRNQVLQLHLQYL